MLVAPVAAQPPFTAPPGTWEPPSGDAPFWGAADIVWTASASDFHFFGFPGTEGPLNLTTGARSCATGQCGWAAGVRLPTGAQILGVEFSFCDSDLNQQLGFWLLRSPKVPGTTTMVVPPTGTGSTPGCTSFVAVAPTPYTVQNDVEGYALVVNSTPGTVVEWNQFRVRYRLQVSPAPATATFPNDVPATHPFFRFVEALAAAGVTGGCGTGSYCPNNPLTRGEMSVFLATALGLHFPN
jgi:hypothetical protein